MHKKDKRSTEAVSLLDAKSLRQTEHKLVELKARVSHLDKIREKLSNLGARYVGTYQQIDRYYEVPKGRLKLREAKGDNEAKLIYYERENVAGSKSSDVYILTIENPEFFSNLLEKTLKLKIVVDKVREIYRHEGTQIHLDTVEKLGTFVEFERETRADRAVSRRDLQILEELKRELGISPENLEGLSYSDILLQNLHPSP